MRLQCNHLGTTIGVALLLAMTMAVTTARAGSINLTPTTGSNSSNGLYGARQLQISAKFIF